MAFGILEHVARDNAEAGKKLALEIRSKAEILRCPPFLGREVVPGLREFVVHQHYILIY